MVPQDFTDQLLHIASADDFASRSADLTGAWSSASTGIETVEPILRFMEEHRGIDFGMPGALFPFFQNRQLAAVKLGFAFLENDQAPDREILVEVALSIRPPDLNLIDLLGLAETKMEARIACREIGLGAVTGSP